MTEKICYLVEMYDPKLPSKAESVIALTPEACFQLDAAGIAYKIVEDFFPKEAPYKDSDAYFFAQLEWIDALDAWLKKEIAYCREKNLSFAHAHYARLKYWSDTVITSARILAGVIASLKPDRIVYVSRFSEPAVNTSIYDLLLAPQSIFFQLIAFVARACGNIPVSYMRTASVVTARLTPRSRGLKLLLKDLAKLFYAKQIRNFFKYKKYLRFKYACNRHARIKALVLHTGSLSTDHVATELIASGAEVYNFVYPEGLVIKESSFFSAAHALLDRAGKAKTIEADFKRASARLSKSDPLVKWFTDKCALDLSAYVLPVLHNFIAEICPGDIPHIEKMRDFLIEKNIDMVIMRASTGGDAIPVLLACANLKKCKTVCFKHFCAPVDSRYVQMIELGFFDYYVTNDTLGEDYFKIKQLERKEFGACRVFQSAHYFNLLPKVKPALGRGSKERVMFAPTDTLIGIYNINNEFMTGARYYRFLKSLIAHFVRRSDKLFTFKYVGTGGWADRSIVPYIKSLGADNITLENKPLIKCLHAADKVLLDHPGTGFYEALAAGKPAMSLYESFMMMDKRSLDHFGKTLEPFSCIEEAIKKIDAFLDAKPEEYLLDIPVKNIGVMDVLNSIHAAL